MERTPIPKSKESWYVCGLRVDSKKGTLKGKDGEGPMMWATRGIRCVQKCVKKEEGIFDPVDKKRDCYKKNARGESQQASSQFMHDKLWKQICSAWGQVQIQTCHDLLHAANVEWTLSRPHTMLSALLMLLPAFDTDTPQPWEIGPLLSTIIYRLLMKTLRLRDYISLGLTLINGRTRFEHKRLSQFELL